MTILIGANGEGDHPLVGKCCPVATVLSEP